MLLASPFKNHLDLLGILTDSRHEFRAKQSCETQLISFVHELAFAMDKKKQYGIAVLAFNKAFDRVLHERLLTKLQHYEVRGNINKWIRSFLSEQSQRVVPVRAVPEGSS
jgi:hypothetical protein